MRNETRLGLSIGIIVLLVVAAAIAPAVARDGGVFPDPQVIALSQRFMPPSSDHVMGTDELGRDIASRLLHGTRVSLAAGVGASLLAFIIGTMLGLAAGSMRGAVDVVVLRLIETFLCFPFFFLVLAIVAILGPSLHGVVIALALSSWPTEARLVRGEALRVRESEFALAATAAGAGPLRLALRHLLPHAVSPAIVSSSFTVGTAILSEAALSFLGLGVSLPQPSWGNIMTGAESQLGHAWWLLLFPGLAIFVTALSFYVLGDALGERLDPLRRGYETPLPGSFARNDSRTTPGTR